MDSKKRGMYYININVGVTLLNTNFQYFPSAHLLEMNAMELEIFKSSKFSTLVFFFSN